MKFCTRHWDLLREAVTSRGMDALVSQSGEQAISNIVSEAEGGLTIDNFDPLMKAHNAIWSMSMNVISKQYQQNPLISMADDAEHPEWACPICALNWCHAEHVRMCDRDGCNYPKEYDWTDEMINGSTDFVLAEWRKLTGST